MVTWSPSLAVGVDEIDAQHRELFRRATLFAEATEKASPQEVGMLLSFLRLHAVTHFGAEEQWMEDTGYPEADEHRMQHDRFLEDLLAMAEEQEREGAPPLDPARVAAWLEEWLTVHVTGIDVGLATHLRRSGLPEFLAHERTT